MVEKKLSTPWEPRFPGQAQGTHPCGEQDQYNGIGPIKIA